MHTLEDAIIVGLIVAVIAFAIWLKAQSEAAQRQMVFEVQKQLIDKLGSGPDVTAFLATEEARKFLDHLKPRPAPDPPKPGPAEVMFFMIWVGTIATFVGGAFFIGAAYVTTKLIVPAAVCAAIGIGMLVGLFITHQLAKKWGIFKNPEDRNRRGSSCISSSL